MSISWYVDAVVLLTFCTALYVIVDWMMAFDKVQPIIKKLVDDNVLFMVVLVGLGFSTAFVLIIYAKIMFFVPTQKDFNSVNSIAKCVIYGLGIFSTIKTLGYIRLRRLQR